MLKDKQVKADWLKALRSGDYVQTTGQLCRKSCGMGASFCCLGVLHNVVVGHTSVYSYEGATTASRRSEESEQYVTLEALGITKHEVAVLTGMNDEEKLSFLDIADYVEANL